MNKQLLIDQLTPYGLDKIEAQIYVYLIESGPRTALQLSREINVDRSKIYRSVEHLISKKFIEQSYAAWGKKLRAASPSNIELNIREEEDSLRARKEQLPTLIEELSKVTSYAKREFEIKHYRGEEGLRQMLWNQLAANKEILAFSYKNKNDIAGKTYAEKIRAEQVARKITLHEVENETDQGDYWYTNVEQWDKFYKSRRIERKTLDIKQYIAVFNDTVSIINWLDDEDVGLEIINTDYADTQKQLFWKFWELASETPVKPRAKKKPGKG